MQLRILTESDIRAIIDMDGVIDAQKEAFALLGEGSVVSGLRSFAVSESPPGAAIFNPSFLKEGKGYGIKVVSEFHENEARGLTRMTALVALFDGRTGYPRTVMEGGYLTDLRTGAGTGLAARYLARPESKVLAVIGAGRVARYQVAAISRVCSIETILVASRSESRARKLVEILATRDGWPRDRVHFAQSVDEAVGRADIAVAATTSHEPVFSGSALRPGTFVAATGAHLPQAREVDDETITRATVRIIDSRSDCLENAGDLMIPIRSGAITRESIFELSELVTGAHPGRTDADEITYYKSVGVPIQDLATAQAIEARAIASGVGTEIDIGGEYC